MSQFPGPVAIRIADHASSQWAGHTLHVLKCEHMSGRGRRLAFFVAMPDGRSGWYTEDEVSEWVGFATPSPAPVVSGEET